MAPAADTGLAAVEGQQRKPRSRSVHIPGFSRLSRRFRPDAEWPAYGARAGRKLGLGSEEHPASRAELRFVPDHAGCDAVDIRNIRTAKPKRVAAARLLLLRGVSLACRRPHRDRERRRQHQAELKLPEPNSHHESPRRVAFRELWVNDTRLARTTEVPSQPVVESARRALRRSLP